MKDPLVSVMMITYNHAPFLAQAIECALQQKTNFPFELVIGEDCSTDGTREIVFEYQNTYPDIIRVITSDKNVGIKKNHYRTMEACRGKYVAVCEGDDYWHNLNKLQKQVDYLESHPECGLVFADCDVHHVESSKITRNFNFNNGYQSPMNLTIEQIINPAIGQWSCTAMMRRDLCQQVIDGDPYLHKSDKFLMGDTQLWAELSLISAVRYIPETLATYRQLEESASHSNDPKRYFRFWKSADEMKLYLYEKHKLSADMRRNIEMSWCDAALRLAYHERNTELAMEVRRSKKIFSWKEWLKYYGAMNCTVFYLYRFSSLLSNIFIRNKKQQL